jgi:hypothetical protein
MAEKKHKDLVVDKTPSPVQASENCVALRPITLKGLDESSYEKLLDGILQFVKF